MVEGYIKNVTGIRRASTSAIKYMEDVATNPSERKNFVSLLAGGQLERFNEILDEINGGEQDLLDTYISGGVARPAPSKEQKYGAKYE
jgi:hypothetical protein